MTIVELAKLSLSQLVKLYNTKADKPVKAFKDKPTALARCEKLSEGSAIVDADGAYAFETVAQRETRLAGLSENEALDETSVAEVPVTSVAEVPVAKKRGPAPNFADECIITVLKSIDEARRSAKGANWARYELYKTGVTVGEYLNAAVALQGGSVTRWRGDLTWDVERGNIEIAEAV